MTIQNARSNVPGNRPPGSADGQIQINQADDALFTHRSDGTTRSFLLPKRHGVADSLIAIAAVDTYVGVSSLTVSRPAVLPAASAYPVGHPLTIADESGACSPTVPLTVTAAGTDRINGNPTFILSAPYAGVTLFSDGASRWTTGSLPASGAANAVLFVAQQLTGGQQDQARLNVNGAVPGFPTATSPLALLDYDRDQYATGTTTLTMPAATPGWRSGVISNANPLTGLVTLAVPSGHSLDGITNGSTTLLPFQRARLRMIAAGLWRTDWLERVPTVFQANQATGVSSIDIPLPAGFSRFRINLSGIVATLSGAELGYQISDSGTAGLKAGSNDYQSQRLVAAASNGSPAQSLVATSYGSLAVNLNSGSSYRTMVSAVFDPGATGQNAGMLSRALMQDTSPQIVTYDIGSYYIGSTGGAIGRANALRIKPSSGNIAGNVIVIGEP